MIGMAEDEDGDVFFDDDFPDIPGEELDILEQNAITFTQQETARSDQRGRMGNESELSRTLLNQIRHGNSLRPQSGNADRNIVGNGASLNEVDNVEESSSNSMLIDEDGLPVVAEEKAAFQRHHYPDEMAQRENWRLSRFAQPQAQVSNGPRSVSTTTRLHPPATSYRHSNTANTSSSLSHVGHGSLQRSVEEEALRARIAELMRERDELTSTLRTTTDELYTRNGEISNIRARQSNEEKTHQRQLVALQKSKQEEADRHAVAMQVANAEAAKSASELQFARHELKEECERTQTLQRQLQDRPLTDRAGNFNTTPKRSHALRDGFDDDEIMIVSPIRSGRKSKQGTPTATRKRKQPTGTANVQPLPLEFSVADGHGDGQADKKEVTKADGRLIATLARDHHTERHLRLIQKVVNFRGASNHDIVIERLFQFSFPSNAARSFGVIVMDEISKLKGPRLPADLAQVFVDLWSKALREKYYVCIPLLTEVVSFILDQDPLLLDVTLLNNLIPLLELTIEINGQARFKLAKRDHLNNTVVSQPVINPDIDNFACMELLHVITSLIVDESELIGLLWRSLSTDFVLMMLNACQPVPEIILMLQILASSILPDTFGNICEASHQTRYESHICDRICILLWQIPKPDADKQPYSPKQICLLRQESLNLLAQLTFGSAPNPFDPSVADNHGTRFIANHQSVIGTAISRLVRSAYEELATAYNMTPTQGAHARLVNTAIRIIHFVLFSPAGRQNDWQSKINGNIGGSHKFRVLMARLTYAEGVEPGIDFGISADTIRMATELIEERITPTEAEDLLRVFEGQSSSGSRRTSALTATQPS